MALSDKGYQSAKWINSAARRRVQARYRAHLIRLLGWPLEVLDQGLGERYAATTGELRKLAHEARKPRRTTRK